MNNILDEMEEDVSSELNLPKNSNLKSVQELAEKATNLDNKIKLLENDLKQAKKEHLQIIDNDLPSMMTEVGMSKFTMHDGSEVKITDVYSGHIKSDNQQEAFNWLRENGHADIIKNAVSINFSMGQDENSSRFVKFCKDNGYEPTQKMGVHPMTLKAFIKERVEAGDSFPMQTFGAFVGQKAIIKGGK